MERLKIAPSVGLMTGGLAVWAAHFMLVYGFVAILCTRAWNEPAAFGLSLAHLGVLAATAVALVGTAILGLIGRRRLTRHGESPSFVGLTAIATALLSALAIVWTALPVYLLPLCS